MLFQAEEDGFVDSKAQERFVRQVETGAEHYDRRNSKKR